MNLRPYYFLCVLCLSILKSRAQSADTSETSKYSFNYTKVVPGMPENASLGAYGNFQVSLAKGTPDIQFNLYTLSKGGVDIPISIAYSASGIKYNDVPSCVGRNWQLNAGGSINRSVNGLADEDYLLENLGATDSARIANQNNHVNSHNTQDTAILVTKNIYDFSLDDYFYSFPGHGGSMYLGRDKTFRPDKEFTRILITAANHLDSFSIKDDAGNTYFFGSYTDNSTVYNNGKYNKQARSSFYARVAWKLKKIITATKQVITFEYIPYIYEYSTRETERYDVYVNNSGSVNVGSCTYSVGFNGSSFQTSRFVNTASLLSKIITDDQEIIFDYFEDPDLYIFKKKLAGIKVYSKISGDTTKRIALTYGGDFLTGFTEVDKSAATPGKQHSFGYHEGTAIDTFSMARDVFGYFNGQTANNSLIDNPELVTYYYSSGVASRTVNATYAASGVLNEITYPTGGKTHFTYEYNMEGTGPTTLYAPGLRVQSTWDEDLTGKTYNKKNFHYRGLAGGTSYADLTIVTENSAVVDPALIHVFSSDIADKSYQDNFYYETVVTETVGDETAATKFYEKSYFASQYELYGKISPVLLRSDVFVGDTFHLQQTTQYDYENIIVDSVTSYSFTLRKPIPFTGYFTYEGDPVQRYCCPPFSIYQGYDLRYILKPRLYNLTTTTTKEYSSVGDSMITISNNTYTASPVALREESTTRGDNLASTTRYSYPFDYSGNSTLVAMTDSFIISPIVREEYYIGSVLKKERRNSYMFDDRGFFVLSDQSVIDVSTGKTKTLHHYGYNSKSELLSQGEDNDIITSYIWDYLDERPIAMVTSADTSSIAYSSFEADGKGRWYFTGIPAADSTAVTGKKTYALSGGSITRTNLSSGAVYLVSYWSKGGALTITGTQSPWPKALSTISMKGQTWTLYEHKITGQSTVTLSGSTTIDELRLLPSYARMVTYTYEPLIGMTSHTNENGRISYYEYDGLNRLILVRDQYRNVIKRTCYNYLGQPEDCAQGLYWNNAISKMVSKTGCGLGYTGSSLIYSVPAGKYSSAISQAVADSLANADFLANAQAYANANGSCVAFYSSVAKSGVFTRNNCDSGYVGGSITYYVPASTYTSFISQEYVDSLAQADVNANGQAYANANTTCVMYCPSCEGANKKCINFICETGVKVYTSSTWDSLRNRYICVYHYEFSDGSWSDSYVEYTLMQCMFTE